MTNTFKIYNRLTSWITVDENLDKSIKEAQFLLAEHPEATAALEHLKEALSPNDVDKDLAAKIKEALNKLEPDLLAEEIKGGSIP